jgi:hypothetical protein
MCPPIYIASLKSSFGLSLRILPARAIRLAKAKQIAKVLIHAEGKRKRVWVSAEELKEQNAVI